MLEMCLATQGQIELGREKSQRHVETRVVISDKGIGI